ncbi:MAG: transcription antitermination factor NusB [Chitinivibrionales bacterium]
MNNHAAREFALKVLYAWEIRDKEEIRNILATFRERDKPEKQIYDYGEFLVQKVTEVLSVIDDLLQKQTENWELKRLSTMDRNTLRLATAELMFSKEIPYKVVIDEALELAKKYSTEKSAKFVNGVIDSIYRYLIENDL